MVRFTFLLFSVCILILSTSCSKEKPFSDSIVVSDQKTPLSNRHIHGCWTESNEEFNENTGIGTFRPCSFMSFPSRRYRFSFILEPDSTCSFLRLSPVDAHFSEDGTWSFNPNTREVTIFDLQARVVKRFITTSVNVEKIEFIAQE